MKVSFGERVTVRERAMVRAAYDPRMPPPRLSAVDASFLYLEQPRTPMHVGAVGIFRAPVGGFDYERLVAVIERRRVAVPRYRQKVRRIPAELARPVWVDDPDFDV